MKDKSLNGQLNFLALALLSVAVTIGFVGVVGLSFVTSKFRKISDINMPNLVNANKMFLGLRSARLNALQFSNPESSPELVERSIHSYEKAHEEFETAHQAYLQIPFIEGEDAVYKEFHEDTLQYFKYIDQAVQLRKKLKSPQDPEWKEMTDLVFEKLPGVATETSESFKKIEHLHQESAVANVNLSVLADRIAFWFMLVFLGVACYMGRRYAKAFSERLVKTLTTVSSSLNEAGEQVSAASTQIASSSQQLSSSSAEQASSLAETAASIEEMNSMVAKNNENAKGAASVSSEAEQTAVRGQQGVERMITSMGEIATSNEQVTDIVKVIREIGEKTKVINDIVFQTKLLSFNASVEAARAGEHGKGFAVVAEEVGNLAQMSGNAAKEITNLLDSSVQKVESIVRETQSKVEAGTVAARECGEILSEIVKDVARVSVMASDISTASAEQASGVGEITKAMNQLDQTTQQNAATSEESASAAEELSAQAESLNRLVGDLMAVINGSGSGVTAQPVKATLKADKSSKKSVKETKQAKVLPIARKADTHKHTGGSFADVSGLKKAAGAEAMAPNFDDSRFEDV